MGFLEEEGCASTECADSVAAAQEELEATEAAAAAEGRGADECVARIGGARPRHLGTDLAHFAERESMLFDALPGVGLRWTQEKVGETCVVIFGLIR